MRKKPIRSAATKFKIQKAREPDPRGYGITVSAYLYPDLYAKLVDKAAATDRTVAKVIEICIRDHIDKIPIK